MKSAKDCYKDGGATKMHKKEEHKKEEHMKKEHMKKEHMKKEHMKKKEHKKAHEVHGEKAKMRIDKKARGGKMMTPKSPLSGAEPSGLPGGGKGENRPDKSND